MFCRSGRFRLLYAASFVFVFFRLLIAFAKISAVICPGSPRPYRSNTASMETPVRASSCSNASICIPVMDFISGFLFNS